MSAKTNENRQTRTEARIAELRAYLSRSKYREEIITHFSPRWGVGETTIAHVMQAALRQRVITYKGVYKAVQ